MSRCDHPWAIAGGALLMVPAYHCFGSPGAVAGFVVGWLIGLSLERRDRADFVQLPITRL